MAGLGFVRQFTCSILVPREQMFIWLKPMEYKMAHSGIEQTAEIAVGKLGLLSTLLSQPGDLVLSDSDKMGLVAIFDGVIGILNLQT